MEQDVVASPVAEVTDVEIMESFMKMNAVAAVVDCYVEHAAIASFAESENLNVFAESADDVNTKKAGGFKKFLNTIWTWLKNIVRAVTQFITGNHLDRAIERCKKLIDENNAAVLNDVPKVDVSGMMTTIEDFVALFKSNRSIDDMKAQINKFIEDSENRAKGFDKKNVDTEGHTAQWVLRMLEAIKKNDWMRKSKKILNEIDLASKDQFKITDGEGGEATTDKELMKLTKQASKILAKEYDKYTSFVTKVTDKLLKNAAKPKKGNDDSTENKSGTATGESYSANTEGYNFL
jgi:hypothetical protein